jgi:WS/DGAT/MGAT family acyltransferase
VEQLTAVDTGFLTMETGTQFGHVGSLAIFEPAATYETTCRQIEQRLHLLPPYRRQLVEVPFGLDLPYWIESPNFDLDFHVRHIAVPSPGNREQLSDLVARLASRPLDRSRPLWEYYVIEGLESGDVAHYAKTHHASIDGASGVEMFSVLLDDEPDKPPPAPPARAWRPEPVPSTYDILGRTMVRYATRPQRMAQAQLRLFQEMAERSRGASTAPQPWAAWMTAWQQRRGGEGADAPSLLPATPAPHTPFNASITAHRRWAFTTLPLPEVKRIKTSFDVTVNDVVLELCASILRRWLTEHHALPSDPLVAMCPVSIRTGQETDKYTNRVSSMIVTLATNVDDPIERLKVINRSTVAAKTQFQAVPAEALQDFAQFSPPALAAMAARMLSRAEGVMDRVNPPFNVLISNVPGPRQPLYLGGAMQKEWYPVSGVGEGMGLNITCMSYMDGLHFGLISCRELVPDLWQMTDSLHDALAELSGRA